MRSGTGVFRSQRCPQWPARCRVIGRTLRPSQAGRGRQARTPSQVAAADRADRHAAARQAASRHADARWPPGQRSVMATQAAQASALQPHVARHILSLRDQRVMLDAKLAALYGVETAERMRAFAERAAKRKGCGAAGQGLPLRGSFDARRRVGTGADAVAGSGSRLRAAIPPANTTSAVSSSSS